MKDHLNSGSRVTKCALAGVALFATITSMAGCTAPRHGPFAAYRDAVEVLQESAERSVRIEADEARRAFIEEASASDQAAASAVAEGLRLRISDASSFAYNPPATPAVFLSMEAASQTLGHLNEAVALHAELLAQLAAGDLTSPEAIDAFAARVNAAGADFVQGLNQASGMIGGETALVIHAPPEDLALVSTVVAEAFRQHLLRSQSDALRRAITAGEPAMRVYAESAQTLIEAAAIGERQRYTARIAAVQEALETGGLQPQKRRKHVEEAIALYETFVARMAALETLHEAYGRLPEAFAELSDAAGGAVRSGEDLLLLARDARLVARRYDTLRSVEGNE